MFVFRVQEADLAGPLVVTSIRERVVDFTKPFMIGNIAAMMKKSHARQFGIHLVRDLARQSDVKYGAVGGGATRDFFRSSKVPDYARMWEVMTTDSSSGLVRTIEEGIQRVLASSDEYPWALLAHSVAVSTRETCDTTIVNSDVRLTLALALPLHSPYKDRFNLAVVESRENGALEAIRTKWFPLVDCESKGTACVSITCFEHCAWLLAFVYALMR